MRAIRTIATTGHRPGSLPRDAERHIRAGVREVAEQYPGATWLTGGAIGADQIATSELLDRGERVELVLPFDPIVQAERWSFNQQLTQLDHLLRVAEVHVVCDRYDRAAYHKRNRRLVERADLLVAFWNGRLRGSGTAATVRLADELQVPVIWVPMT